MRTLAIFNPAAGGGRAARRRHELARLCDAAFGPVEWFETRGIGDATLRAARAESEGVERIVAIGGDGTTGEILAGLFDPESGARRGRTQLAVLPTGTGDDLARALGLGGDPEALLRQLRRARARRIDIGCARFHDEAGRPTQRLFANVASAGLSALAARSITGGSRRMPRPLRYFAAGLRALWAYAPGEIELCVEGPSTPGIASATRIRPLLLAVGNGACFGGGLPIAPGARLDDGLFEIVWVEDANRLRVSAQAHRLLRGKHLDLSYVHSARGVRIRAEPTARTRVPLELDGEACGWLPLRCELRPGALEVWAPPPAPRVTGAAAAQRRAPARAPSPAPRPRA